MGNAPVTDKLAPLNPDVIVNVYDIGTSGGGKVLNSVLRPLGTGAFHCGVEIFGWEYGYSNEGIYYCPPRECKGHTFCESIHLGRTKLSQDEVFELLGMLEVRWPGNTYDLLQHNCCHFSNEFCKELNVGAVPERIMNLASAGAHVTGIGCAPCRTGLLLMKVPMAFLDPGPSERDILCCSVMSASPTVKSADEEAVESLHAVTAAPIIDSLSMNRRIFSL
mmetsp:Transcript_4840/g.9885  ORF Transcript_4840/g.9885 Transcript_4840/m.9885 type:complete len:221 (-) Transcript_4840:66-728(-)